jgi:DNA polymerase III epsilon subunit-like protein
VSWADGVMQGFDTETDGVDVEDSRIVSISLVECGPAGSVEHSAIVNTGRPIPEEAAAVHGITTDRMRAEGLPARETLMEYVELLRQGQQAGLPIVGYNTRFDLTLLDRECRRHGIEPLTVPVVVDPRVIDPWLDRYRRGSRRLQAVCEHYRVPPVDWHDSAADALAACRLAWVLAKRGEVVRRCRNQFDRDELTVMQEFWARARDDLGVLQTAQAKWAADQADGLAAHFKRQGNPDWRQVLAQKAWPVVPVDGGMTGGLLASPAG